MRTLEHPKRGQEFVDQFTELRRKVGDGMRRAA
jgi:hypothetical protein